MPLPDQQTLLLLVVVLLLVWLLTRTRERRVERAPRKRPLTEEELGRAVFLAAREADLEAFRHLYLSGGEARVLMNESAVSYLADRDASWLVDELVEIGARIGGRSSYAGARLGPESMLILRLRAVDGAIFEVPAGSALQVDLVWRIRDPVGRWPAAGNESARA